MKTLLAKMKVSQVTDFGNNNKESRLSAVHGDSEENKTFSLYTPRAEVVMMVNNPNAVDFFKAGEEVYVSFSKDRLPDAENLLTLLTNLFMLSYPTVNGYNIVKVITTTLTHNGIKTFLMQDGRVVDLKFLQGQLNEQDYAVVDTCPVDDNFSVQVRPGEMFGLTRLT